MARIGYARVSSVGQSLAVQREKLTHCDKIYEEKKSGATAARPQLVACLDYVREGDVLLVTRLDRLARSTLHLCQIAAELALRHSALTHAAEAGANTATLLAYSGHTSVTSLARYARVSPEALARWQTTRDRATRRRLPATETP